MKIKHIFFVLLLSSACSEKEELTLNPNPLQPETIDLGEVTVTPSSINPDTVSSLPLPIRISGKIYSDERINAILTLGIKSKNGYSSTVSESILLTPNVPEFISNFNLNFDPSLLEKPEFFISISKQDGYPVVTQTGIIKIDGYDNSTAKIDSILFSPANGVKRGNQFSMQVYVSDSKGIPNIKRVFVLGKRPDGTQQTPFELTLLSPSGIFNLITTTEITTQTGTFKWTFYAQEKSGALSRPVTKSYQVLP